MGSQFDLTNYKDGVLYVNFQGSKSLFTYSTTFRVDDFIEKIKQAFSGSKDEKKELFDEGIDCEILKPNASWQKGRIRIALEFCPDELEVEEALAEDELEISQLESPLADIRQMVTENHQQGNS